MTESRRRAVRINGQQNPHNRIAQHMPGAGGLATLAMPLGTAHATPEVGPKATIDDGDNGFDDIDEDDDEDDDDDDDEEFGIAEAEKIVIAGQEDAVLTEAKVTFLRKKGKLYMVAQIEDILPTEEDEDEDVCFATDGSEMFEGDIILRLGKGYADCKKGLDPDLLKPSFFKKGNFREDLPEVE